MTRQLATIAALVAALALPAGALAMTGRAGGGTAATGIVRAQPVNLLQDGKYLVAHRTHPAADVVRVVEPGGFHIADASVGVALAVATLAVVGGLVVLRRDGTFTSFLHHSKAR
jgi:hypothetical protein